jgi:hypothetical protein
MLLGVVTLIGRQKANARATRMVLPQAPNPSRANRPPPRAMELPICESGKAGFTAPAGKQAAGEAAVLEP